MTIQAALTASFQAEPVLQSVFQQDAPRDEFYQGIVAHVVAKQWTEVGRDSWEALPIPHVMMRYLTPEAFHYYLPSLLLAVWNEPGYFERGIQAVSPNNPKGAIRGSWWPAYRSLFTPEQETLIRGFLRHVAESEAAIGIQASGAESVMEMFWGNLQN